MDYDAILFDNDGVLLERTDGDRSAFEDAVRSAFRDHRVTKPDLSYVADLVYGVTVSRLESICETYGLDVEAFWQSRGEAYTRVQCDAMRAGRKGLYPDVQAVDGLEGPTGVVSTDQQRTLAFAYDHLDARRSTSSRDDR